MGGDNRPIPSIVTTARHLHARGYIYTINGLIGTVRALGGLDQLVKVHGKKDFVKANFSHHPSDQAIAEIVIGIHANDNVVVRFLPFLDGLL